MKNGFLRVASCSPLLRVADVDYNVDCIIGQIKELDKLQVDVAVFPELCVTGYTCGDLFHNEELLDAALRGLNRLRQAVADVKADVIVGLPMLRGAGGALMNCAVLLRGGGGEPEIVEKTYLPSYNEFYERRWFAPSDRDPRQPQVFESHGARIAVEICEDLWVPVPPSTYAAMAGAQVVFNLSASDDVIGKHDYLVSLIKQQSARCLAAYVYSSAGFGDSTTDLV